MLNSGRPQSNTLVQACSVELKTSKAISVYIFMHAQNTGAWTKRRSRSYRKNWRLANVTKHAGWTYCIHRIHRIYLHYRIPRIYTMDKR